jgi:uroporphyrin-III C-methyltransferase/precorrin-2 dehydrogenase/sirohydrochlorin ferrochelatase
MSGSSHITALPSLPLFHRLEGRKVVVFGSSDGSAWKAELLAAAGSKVLHLADDWSPENIAGAALAIGDFSDEGAARRFAEAGRKAGALVNIIDRPDLSDFQFGTIVNRSPIVIGISTDGAAPMLGQSIRQRIESVLPFGLASWAEAAKAWRPRLKRKIASFKERRAFWGRFVAWAWSEHQRLPTEADFQTLLNGAPAITGKVTLVGAGPGDPGLLTLKAVHALQSATVVLHDQLVGPAVLELARREARRIAVGKTGHGPSCKQDDINRLMVDLARGGENVVRLKGGDPMIFGRATEEMDACDAAGIRVEVVPGVSAAQAAAASLRISLTERRRARRIQFVTGHGADGRLPHDIDWHSIADPAATTVLYMPRRTFDEFVRKALTKGLDPATPAIAIASVSLPEEIHAAGRIAEIGALAELPAGAPVTVIIGWVGRKLVPANSTVLPFPKALAS